MFNNARQSATRSSGSRALEQAKLFLRLPLQQKIMLVITQQHHQQPHCPYSTPHE
jgi:hypothetical protein